MKKGFIKFFLFFTVTAAVLCGCGGEGKTAFTVNEVAVSREELVFYMRRLSDTVIAQIEEKYELSAEDKEFWEKPIGNTTPLELLRDTAQKEIVRSKILFLEAEKCGDKLPLTYSEQQTAWKKDNEERQTNRIDKLYPSYAQPATAPPVQSQYQQTPPPQYSVPPQYQQPTAQPSGWTSGKF